MSGMCFLSMRSRSRPMPNARPEYPRKTCAAQHLGMSQSALPHLDPLTVGQDVNLATIEGVGMLSSFASIGKARAA